MTLAAELTGAEIGAFRNEIQGFDAKTALAYLELTLQLRLRGSLPEDDRYLAAICRVSKRFWLDRVKPILREILTFDNGRVSHPDIDRVPPQAARAVPSQLSLVRSDSATKGWEKRRSNDPGHASPDANPDANGMQNPMQTDAKLVAKSMAGASGLHHAEQDFASDPSRTSSLSLVEESSIDSIADKRERESARAPARTGVDANRDANPDANHANGHANGHAKPDAKPASSAAPKLTLLPEDWVPFPDIEAEIEATGRDPAAIVDAFRAYNQMHAKMRADWHAAFRYWWRKTPTFDPVNPQIPLVRSIDGGAAGTGSMADIAKKAADAVLKQAAEAAACAGTGPEAAFARAVRAVRQLGGSEASYWLDKVRFGGIEGDEAVVCVESAYIRDHVASHYGDTLTTRLQAELPAVKLLNFEVAKGRQAAR